MGTNNFDRKIDERGRLVIPKEIIEKYHIKHNAKVTLKDNGNGILTIDLMKHNQCPKCKKIIPVDSKYCCYCSLKLK